MMCPGPGAEYASRARFQCTTCHPPVPSPRSTAVVFTTTESPELDRPGELRQHVRPLGVPVEVHLDALQPGALLEDPLDLPGLERRHAANLPPGVTAERRTVPRARLRSLRANCSALARPALPRSRTHSTNSVIMERSQPLACALRSGSAICTSLHSVLFWLVPAIVGAAIIVSDSSGRWIGVLLFVVGALASVSYALAWRRVDLHAASDRVEIGGLFHTRVLSWDDIQRFEILAPARRTPFVHVFRPWLLHARGAYAATARGSLFA